MTRAEINTTLFDEVARLRERNAELESNIERLLNYFGGPVGVSMHDLGQDAYVEIPMKVRIGDLIDARACLNNSRLDA